jgi:hypothetical protein
MRKWALVVLLGFSGWWAAPRAAETGARSNPGPVLVELYTSQGCSSCPPADEVFSTWAREAFERGEIVPLAFHVDYWDRLGWKDPFSSSAATRRQRFYARALGLRYAYTPQMIVAGRVEFNGSDLSRARREVERFSSGRDPADIVVAPSFVDGRLTVKVKIRTETDFPVGAVPLAMLAVFENGHVTRVTRGENAGRTLRGDFVVRDFASLGPLPEDGKGFEKSAEVNWDPSWKKENSGVAVFIQDNKTFEVYAAASSYPLSRLPPVP